jgi:hypothetical protein
MTDETTQPQDHQNERPEPAWRKHYAEGATPVHFIYFNDQGEVYITIDGVTGRKIWDVSEALPEDFDKDDMEAVRRFATEMFSIMANTYGNHHAPRIRWQ